MARIQIFDTTLRDGEQSPGATMTPSEKLRLAHQLEALGVDIIEAGFPISSIDDFNGVRNIAREIPIWDPEICIDCAKCALVCPHASIRMKVFEPGAIAPAPEGFLHKEWKDREHPGRWMTIQVAPDDCTGCGICVDVCPAHSKEEVKHRAIDMLPKDEHLDRERTNWDFFLTIPDASRADVRRRPRR